VDKDKPCAPKTSQSTPTVWVIAPYRAGEKTQVMALAQSLRWPLVVKELTYRKVAAIYAVLRGDQRYGLRSDQTDILQPPWPDLVITAGLRNEPVCRWIQRQSGGRTRIVHVGRPWADPACFDLVVTTPQYRLPQRANVLHNNLTLHTVDDAFLQAQRVRWQSKVEHLSEPRIAVIVGGNSGPYTLGTKAARRLAHAANAMAIKQGGSLLVTTSSRTSSQATQALQKAITAPHVFYHWRPKDSENPYYSYLALADALIVTADSIAMLSEACATGKPLYMFDIGSGANAMRQLPQSSSNKNNDFRVGALLYRYLMRWGPQLLSRDITLVHRRLVDTGRAVWLGDQWHDKSMPPIDDLKIAVKRIYRLF
jgi:mitochondrial fission protein ELM1